MQYGEIVYEYFEATSFVPAQRIVSLYGQRPLAGFVRRAVRPDEKSLVGKMPMRPTYFPLLKNINRLTLRVNWHIYTYSFYEERISIDIPMSVKQTAKRLYGRIIDGAGDRNKDHQQPKEGWLSTMRKALGMSGPQMAKRAGVTKAAIYQAERKELAGEITINQLEKYASILGGKLVYAIVPDSRALPQGKGLSQSESLAQGATIADLMHNQAMQKATALINTASTHMALEKQALSEDANRDEIMRLAERLERDPPSDFWDGQ